MLRVDVKENLAALGQVTRNEKKKRKVAQHSHKNKKKKNSVLRD